MQQLSRKQRKHRQDQAKFWLKKRLMRREDVGVVDYHAGYELWGRVRGGMLISYNKICDLVYFSVVRPSLI